MTLLIDEQDRKNIEKDMLQAMKRIEKEIQYKDLANFEAIKNWAEYAQEMKKVLDQGFVEI